MVSTKLELINDQTSPLLRIKWAFEFNQSPHRKFFCNNVCAFHIGGGYILTVGHTLHGESGIVVSVDDSTFRSEICDKLEKQGREFVSRCLLLEEKTGKRFLRYPTQNAENDERKFKDYLRAANFDTRYITMLSKSICKPYLLIEFNNNLYYNDSSFSSHFDSTTNFEEGLHKKHYFVLDLDLVEVFLNHDIAIFKINAAPNIIEKIPSVGIDYSFYEDDVEDIYCLQSSPNGTEMGRLLNNAQIDGVLNQHSILQSGSWGSYINSGLRYLIKGYFRFGSSGAPYLVYDGKEFKVNAIQSEACPVQLTINGNRDNSFQWISAIATPLSNIQERLEKLTTN